MRIEVELTGKGRKARVEANQSTVMFSDGGGQVVIPDFAGHSVQLLKRVNVAAGKGFATLRVSELQILHPAVPVDQSEGIELPLIPVVIERIEVAPIDFEAFAWLWFHAHKSSLRFLLRPYLAHVLAKNTAAAGIAQRLKTLSDHGGAGGRIFIEQLQDGCFIGIELAGAGPSRRCLSRHVQILLDRLPAHS